MGSGYIINNKTAKLLYNNLVTDKCLLPIDDHIMYIINKLKLNSYFYNYKLIKHNFSDISLLAQGRRANKKMKNNV